MKKLFAFLSIALLPCFNAQAEENKEQSLPVFFIGAVAADAEAREKGTFDYNGQSLYFNRTGKGKETVWTGNASADTPSNITTPVGWADIVIEGKTYKVPLYQ